MRSTIEEVARRPYWREEDARVVVEAWERSGEPLAAFARGHEVDPHRIARWARRLNSSDSSVPLRFHAVKVTTSEGAGAIEIHVGAGWRVRVPRDFAPEDLRRVLAVLGEKTEKTTC